ncbi:hypothetical protein PtrSN002B_001084 [Pyrenophora tritici-repentis]|uniref:Uncharacterized protein n=2 Tax=Pyrenophora tritici-repentis TaxID=45151 RepID=A0A2W1FHC6_9PLEO|nr:uncharacterized protein PTRG_05758 [Pyrenophora tritici-repentis Pt-1C-BFP]KAA8618846.1 hypothetical protein PtrV1_08275 [Pyrenophora tritici-repentis]EDU48678.1 conserved hypothetical protein [Pyrenophora tritici-repentis Pt-1C-BFP]KAF7449312.1 hypothetical protein A1F99_063610 [Pyrenophora tritici-repentis]KAF7570672.1 hypothetical protein PtrM4_106740 [Pyrenophora tritici-repentis]KAG9383742.1 hypothetical protein A1F94_005653 [Pyrenophora tritici-repentis]
MLLNLATLATLSTLGSVVSAANIYTYFQPGCGGCGTFFKDIGPQTCALSYRGTNNATEAVEKQWTGIQSAKLQVWSPANKVFQLWRAGPGLDNATKLPLQCGTETVAKDVTYFETCIDVPGTGASWYKPNPNQLKRADRGDHKCTSSQEFAGWWDSKKQQHYTKEGMTQDEKDEMDAIMKSGGGAPDKFNNFKVDAPEVKPAN